MGSCVSNEEEATTVQDLRATSRATESSMPPPLEGDDILRTEESTPFPDDVRDVSPPHSWRVNERRRSSNNSMMAGRRRSSAMTASPNAGSRLPSEKRTSLLSSSRKSITTFQSTVDALWSSSHCTTIRGSVGSSMEVGGMEGQEEHATEIDPRTLHTAATSAQPTTTPSLDHQDTSNNKLAASHRLNRTTSSSGAAGVIRRRSLNTSNVLVPLSQIGSDPSSASDEEEGVAVVDRIEDLTF